MISHTRPIIWKFIESLKKEESLNKMIIEQIIAGLMQVCKNVNNNPICEVLKGIAHNFNFYK
ncbi:MULE domain-containing protein [Aphis craccivora]|uniref:MULE domain-containing protein n=1 Tax=Aphis craccivora TaxID=307492 RepID=A0A6G0W357_APHCR|nr:MULE domain-containing protein [Aphis craccivora]